MKLPASVLAKLCLTGVVAGAGCETAVDFERRNPPPAPVAKKGVPERIEIVQEQPRYAAPPPAAAPITKAPPTIVKPTLRPVPTPQSKAHACGPCGMG